jgi:hypothetical protein
MTQSKKVPKRKPGSSPSASGDRGRRRCVGGAPAVAAPLQLIAVNFRLQTSHYNPVGGDADAVLPKASVAAVVDAQTGQAPRQAAPERCGGLLLGVRRQFHDRTVSTGHHHHADASTDGQYDGKTVVLASSDYQWQPARIRVFRVSFVDDANLAAQHIATSCWMCRGSSWPLSEYAS